MAAKKKTWVAYLVRSRNEDFLLDQTEFLFLLWGAYRSCGGERDFAEFLERHQQFELDPFFQKATEEFPNLTLMRMSRTYFSPVRPKGKIVGDEKNPGNTGLLLCEVVRLRYTIGDNLTYLRVVRRRWRKAIRLIERACREALRGDGKLEMSFIES